MNIKTYCIVVYLGLICAAFGWSQQLIIQENEQGFCSLDGFIETSVAGYTGAGYADTDIGPGASINWSVYAQQDGNYYLSWRYAVGGGSGDRDVRLLINGNLVYANINFPHTGEWTNWIISDSVEVELQTGSNQIRIEALNSSGTGNYDYLIAHGEGLSAGECLPYYTLNLSQNYQNGGTISVDPEQDYYTQGMELTLSATANQGYFFHSWSGDVTSADSLHTFIINGDFDVKALFLPAGTKIDPQHVGYAGIQDDQGTPYPLTGGSLGDSVHATSIESLETYLGSSQPMTITFSDKFVGISEINIASDKTLLGIGDNAHLEGIGLNVNGVRNVIIKNITVSKVTPQDAIEINGALNVWIDQCDFFTDKDHGSEYYDGLLDIKNESSFITVSWSKFHDHFKTILITSNDESPQDSVTRVTFHHNYFYNCGSRLPSIRFGKAHIFNNYYKDCDHGINSRMGACVRVEKNYFYNTNPAVTSEYSLELGMVELIDNIFHASTHINDPTCGLEVPYDYASILSEPEELPMLIAGDVTDVDESSKVPQHYAMVSYPNPFNPLINIQFTLPESGHTKLTIYNALGQQIVKLADKMFSLGSYTLKWNANDCSSGIYYIRIESGDYTHVRKAVLIK